MESSSRRLAHSGRTYETGLKLSRRDQKTLAKMMRGGQASVRVTKRVRALQLLGEGEERKFIAKAVGIASSTVGEIKVRYREGGLERVLRDLPRGRHEPVIKPAAGERLVAMLCGPSPSGRARWTIELARDEAMERKIVPKVGRETIRVFMHGHHLKPWREKNVVHSVADAGVRRADGESS